MQEQTDDNAGADLAPAIQISEATVVTRLEQSHKIATRKANVGGRPRGTRTPEIKLVHERKNNQESPQPPPKIPREVQTRDPPAQARKAMGAKAHLKA